ncbi:uncharacterized protein LOC130965839 [Arachis stenosperma]|uniref:uncharacterized protein LOC130965839 n=1 Tax=Arachis stenosperma TaxID=217475 RepID=UPI0025ACAD59|nr:uncharacterized protein LOC130965839 [Arachis stenosperma]
MVTLFKELGYTGYKEIFWLDMRAPNMEAGLHAIKGDMEINQMKKNKLINRDTDKLYIYFKHQVDMPEVIEDAVAPRTVVVSSSSSSSNDGYETIGDEPYKPPPGYETDDSSSDKEKRAKKQKRGPKKSVSGKRKVDEEAAGYETDDKGSNEELSNTDGLHEFGSVPTNVEMDSDYEKSYEYESEAFNSPISSVDEGKTAYNSFDEDTEYSEVEFKVRQLFPTIEVFKKALKDYFVYEGKDVLYIKNEKYRLRAACVAEGCPWLIFTSWNSAIRCFQVKTLFDEHTCVRGYGSNMADRQWVAAKIIKKLLIQLDMKPRHAMEHIIEEYNVQLNPRMIAKALKVARKVVIGNAREQYKKVRDYLNELHRSNPNSTVLVESISQSNSFPLFDRLYISLDASKKGFKEGCRPLIGLDGCFLKGYYGGQLLSAVGQDANNHFFVIAFAVVLNECKDT